MSGSRKGASGPVWLPRASLPARALDRDFPAGAPRSKASRTSHSIHSSMGATDNESEAQANNTYGLNDNFSQASWATIRSKPVSRRAMNR